MSLPVFRAVGATYAFFFGNFLRILRVTWLPTLIIAGFAAWNTQLALNLLRYPFVASVHVEASKAALDAVNAAAPLIKWSLAFRLIEIVLLAIVSVGLVRPIVRGDWPRGIFYLGFGLDELRVLLARFMAYVLFFAAYFGSAIVVVLLLLLAGALNKYAGVALLGLGVAAVVVVLIWITLRMFLIAPASVSERSIGFLSSWAVTERHSWQLLALVVLVGAPLVILALILLCAVFWAELPTILPQMREILSNPDVMPMRFSSGPVLALVTPVAVAIGVVEWLMIVLLTIASGFAYRLLTKGASEA